jgi:Protein of unknown function (DUF3224)
MIERNVMAEANSKMTWDPWQPTPYGPEGAPALLQGTVSNHYSGDIEAEGAQQCLIVLFPGGTSTFVSVERVTGSVGGRSGSFVLRLEGSTAAGAARADLSIVPDSGTGELTGLTGTGTYFCDNPGPHGHASVTLEYSFS